MRAFSTLSLSNLLFSDFEKIDGFINNTAFVHEKINENYSKVLHIMFALFIVMRGCGIQAGASKKSLLFQCQEK
jgi:hypothetical protein